VLATSSAVVNMAMSAFARVVGLADVSQTVVFASGPPTQSGKEYACAAPVMANTNRRLETIVPGGSCEGRPHENDVCPSPDFIQMNRTGPHRELRRGQSVASDLGVTRRVIYSGRIAGEAAQE
jgi:hypothetical protein